MICTHIYTTYIYIYILFCYENLLNKHLKKPMVDGKRPRGLICKAEIFMQVVWNVLLLSMSDEQKRWSILFNNDRSFYLKPLTKACSSNYSGDLRGDTIPCTTFSVKTPGNQSVNPIRIAIYALKPLFGRLISYSGNMELKFSSHRSSSAVHLIAFRV